VREYAAKKKATRRDRFLGEIDAVTPWPALPPEMAPFLPTFFIIPIWITKPSVNTSNGVFGRPQSGLC
jgi:hypothetical protein